jgi:fused signal recognition particle receptor
LNSIITPPLKIVIYYPVKRRHVILLVAKGSPKKLQLQIISEGGTMGFFERLKEGLTKTRKTFAQRVESIFTGRVINEQALEELEEVLIASDVGTRATSEIMTVISEKVKEGEAKDLDSVKELLKKEMVTILGDSRPIAIFGSKPFVILAVGVNGVGKTTTIGKLASRFRSEGLSVLLAAGDTFRAAGIEQLEIWAERADTHFVKHQSGSDPAAVAYDAVTAARSRGIDTVIIDTAGRLHTKSNLMEELKKVKRSIDKAMPGAPQEILLVVDATTGQNALRQAELFNEAVGITGIALTKLDGTAKGGIVFAIRRGLGIPVRLIGVGEKIDDLRDFDPGEFVEALFS